MSRRRGIKYATVIGLIAGILVVGLFAGLLAYPFMLMWNYSVVAALTIANPIGYWQSFWLMMLIGLFVTSKGKNG